MKVKMRTYYASPNFSADIGQVIDVSDPEGEALVGGGFADEVLPDVPEESVEEEVQEEPEVEEPKEEKKPRKKK